ncbi:hypothetical protein BC827DRAFT_1263578 [Russula dissimulans]|nr:hypothetical protein BC827DRAFT_1263578 [Russula dissimulans]
MPETRGIANPIAAHQRGVLDIVARIRHQFEKVELQEVSPHMPEKDPPRDIQERRDLIVAYKEQNLRARHLVRKRKDAPHGSKVKRMDCNDEVSAEYFHALGPPKTLLKRVTSSSSSASSCVRAASALCRLRQECGNKRARIFWTVALRKSVETSTDPEANSAVDYDDDWLCLFT